MSERSEGRGETQLRATRITRDYLPHAEGSCLIEMGNTHVICTASISHGVPRWLKGGGQGWVTAEYGMLPRSTGERMRREAAGNGQGGRTMEIQRLIGRALRTVTDLRDRGVDTLILGCTHYPLLKPAIARFMGPDVALVDSADALAESAERALAGGHLLRGGGEGNLTFYLSDIPWTFTEVGARFLGQAIPGVTTVNLDELEADGRLDLVRKDDET